MPWYLRSEVWDGIFLAAIVVIAFVMSLGEQLVQWITPPVIFERLFWVVGLAFGGAWAWSVLQRGELVTGDPSGLLSRIGLHSLVAGQTVQACTDVVWSSPWGYLLGLIVAILLIAWAVGIFVLIPLGIGFFGAGVGGTLAGDPGFLAVGSMVAIVGVLCMMPLEIYGIVFRVVVC